MHITTYNFTPSLSVRTVLRSGEPWFIAADVCAVLEIANTSDALGRLDADERTLVSTEGIHSGAGNPTVNAINESGLYSLIMTSRKPEAKKFKKWVTAEVLPSIRKTGSYSAVPALTHSYADAMTGLDIVCRSTNLEGSAKLGMFRKGTELTAPHLLQIIASA